MAEIQKLQDALLPGDTVVTTAGLHANVVSVGEELVDLEIAPGIITSWEKMSVVRVVTHANEIVLGSQATHDEISDGFDQNFPPVADQFPDFHPENRQDNDDQNRSNGHPENR